MRGDGKTGDRKNVMTGAEMVVTALAEQGVRDVFGYPGGNVLPVYDALGAQSFVRHTLVAHEQGAVHAAQGYARSTGSVGCVLVTSGPGATNTVTGVMDAYADSTPLVVISGQVNRQLIGTDAFQECDITGITRSCTKHNYLVRNIDELPQILHEAFSLAQSGRPGPVLVDIPKDVQCAKGIYHAAADVVCRTDGDGDKNGFHPFSVEAMEQAVVLMREAKRPIFYTGGGVIISGEKASALLRELVKETGFPITSTLMGLGAYPASGREWLGMLGMHGTYQANMAMHDADLIIAIGARFDDRVTGKIDEFAPYAKKIHIDIDPSSINKNVRVDLGIVADCEQALEEMLKLWREERPRRKQQDLWRQSIEAWKKKKPVYEKGERIHPSEIFGKLEKILTGRDVYIVTDVGQHQMWAAQYMGIDEPRRFITSGGMGTMGFGLPAAIGVQKAHPDALVVLITGDGSFTMNCQEMITAAREGLPIKTLVLNNNALGMVRQLQEQAYGGRYVESANLVQPDFTALATAFGWKGLSCVTPRQVARSLKALIDTKDRPCLIDCRIEPDANCYPMIAPGAGHNKMLFGPTP